MENLRKELREFEDAIASREDAMNMACNFLRNIFNNDIASTVKILNAQANKDWMFFADKLLAINARNEIIVNKLIGRLNEVKRYKQMKNDTTDTNKGD
jgi:hypothetical protein